MNDGGWFRDARRLNDDAVKCKLTALLARHEFPERLGNVAPECAAQATRLHQDRFFGRRFDQIMVKASRAEFVHDHSNPACFWVIDQVVQHGGLPGAKKACQQSDRDTRVCGVHGRARPLYNPAILRE